MSRDAVRVLSRWSGYCRPCSSEDRPLVLVWSGPDRLRTRLLGPEPGTGTLRLTCSVCGGTDLVGWEDEPEPVVAVEEAPVEVAVLAAALAEAAAEVPALAAGEPAPVSSVEELREPADAPVALDGVAADAPAALDGAAAAVAASEVQAVPVDEPEVGPMLWQPAPPPAGPVAYEAVPAEPVAHEPLAHGPLAYEPVPTVHGAEPVAHEPVAHESLAHEPAGPAPEPAPYVPGLSADVAAALRELAAPSVPAPRSDADLDALELLEG